MVISIEKSKFDTLVFPQLELIAKKRFRFLSKNLPDTIKINLDLVDYGFGYSEVTYDYWDKPMKLKIDEDRLSNLEYHLKQVKK